MTRAGIRLVAENTRSWVEIDEARLKENYRVVREAAGAEVLAVVKANAYGHGLERCAVALARAGARWLGVADAVEGVRVRRALEAEKLTAGPSTSAAARPPLGMTDPSELNLLAMCGVTRDEVSAIAEHGLTPVVWTMDQVELLRGTGARVHVEIETGMGRQGVRPGVELEELLRTILGAGLKLEGACTHFHSAEIAGSERTKEQKKRFEEALGQIDGFGGVTPTSQNRDVGYPDSRGFAPQWVHAGASSSVDVGEDAGWLEKLAQSGGARAMVRSGIAVYGYCLPAVGAESKIRAKLKPVMTWKTRVLDVREVAARETIGYNATFTAKQAMRVALLPVGYADGMRRELSGTDERAGGWVMVRGSDGKMHRANIVGRISMNLTTVDVTATGGVGVGDEVVLLGDGVTADDHARIAGTISYEILCGIKASCQF
ncbi:MAG TPA: alanine racemase [Acidobacteriaceae bacterium]|nr:alanine racemase [Acidobacteriaceae bacterium]